MSREGEVLTHSLKGWPASPTAESSRDAAHPAARKYHGDDEEEEEEEKEGQGWDLILSLQ